MYRNISVLLTLIMFLLFRTFRSTTEHDLHASSHKFSRLLGFKRPSREVRSRSRLRGYLVQGALKVSLTKGLSYTWTSQTKCHKQSGTVFSSLLLMPFQMVCSVLQTVLHLKTLLLIGCKFSTANQKATNKWFLMATQREKRSTPSERVLQTELKTGVRLFVAFCLN